MTYPQKSRTSEYAVEVNNLTKIYGSGENAVIALKDANLKVEAGELAAILGPSGSGKSTLLTSIGLVTEPTSGGVILDGITVAADGWLQGVDLKKIRREKIGFIFQSHNLVPFLTALENVMLVLTIADMPPRRAKERATALLIRLGLGDRLASYPAQLSGGQSQRVAIARALANRPRVVLADEPTAALDTENGQLVMKLLKELAVEHHSAIMVVTHDHRMVEGFDRIYHVSDGRISSGDQPQAYSQYIEEADDAVNEGAA